ncbi:type VII secretion target [Mycobacterium kyorinense]|nr:type VII secretion target [Mycobacterium kyorinense]
MDENLGVDSADVQLAGEHVDTHAADLLAGHGAAHERIAAAHGGVIGESAAALAELAAYWTDETASHHGELCNHADDLRTAADKYDATDTDARTTIDATVSDLAERMSAGWG